MVILSQEMYDVLTAYLVKKPFDEVANVLARIQRNKTEMAQNFTVVPKLNVEEPFVPAEITPNNEPSNQ
jgi:hypothetical protein